ICDVFDLPVEAVFSRAAFTPLSAELYGRQDANGRKSTDVTPDHSA
ncbi:MAG: hypothetical protein QOD90_5093, partial [Mycobacterium sp.]|nr:hypothetical protein [Mycobacterium sp.]